MLFGRRKLFVSIAQQVVVHKHIEKENDTNFGFTEELLALPTVPGKESNTSFRIFIKLYS